MITRTHANPGAQFDRGARLTLTLVSAVLIYAVASLAYRFTLPTDGWEVNEANNLPGFAYTANLLGEPSGLRPGDQVVAVEGVPADWKTMPSALALRAAWRVGATLDYTVARGGVEVQVPVTLARWQLGQWLRVTLRDPAGLAKLASAYSLLVLAAFIFLRRPGNPAAGPFLIFFAGLASTSLSETLPSGLNTWIDPLANVLTDVNWYLLLALVPYALIRFALVFPHPKPIYERHPWLPYAAAAVGVALLILAPGSPVSWFWFLLSLLLTVIILIHNALTMRDAVSRAQVQWGLGGMIIGLGTLTLMFLAGTSGLVAPNNNFFNVAQAFATTIMGGMLAVAITRYRLFDIDVVIRRTLVYAVLTAVLALLYFGSVVILQSLLRGLTGGESPLVIVLSTLLIAALFAPLRARVQRTIDRRFYRRKYDAARTLAAFGAQARDETDLARLSDRLQQTVQGAMEPAHVGLWLRPNRLRERP